MADNPALVSKRSGYEFAKRLTDLGVSFGVLLVGAPVWAAIAIAIRAEDRGPALHRGRVVGRGGVEFTYFKFRSMRQGDSSPHHQWLRDYVLDDQPAHEGDDPVYKLVDESRVTRIGRWLRRTGLDEVPQFINVVRGEMSVVGPRPPLVVEYEHYNHEARQRLAVKPGITGLYQVTERGRAPFSRMLAIDLEYIAKHSWWLDFTIMLRTVRAVFRGEGA